MYTNYYEYIYIYIVLCYYMVKGFLILPYLKKKKSFRQSLSRVGTTLYRRIAQQSITVNMVMSRYIHTCVKSLPNPNKII